MGKAVLVAASAAAAELPDLDVNFRPRFPWWGGDLQTLHNRVMKTDADLTPWPSDSLTLPMADDSGDRLLARLHRNGGGAKPLVLLIHGMTGCEDSSYIRVSSRFFLERGHPILRLNLRGAGPSNRFCRRHYNAGSSQDLQAVFAQLRQREKSLMAAGCFAVGYSLGGNILLKTLAENAGSLPLRAAVSVSTPLDLKATQANLMKPRNKAYHGYLLRGLCRDRLAGPLVSDEERQIIATKVRSIYDYDNHIVAPANGFVGAEDYYAKSAAGPRLGEIRTETLVIHASDDPWIPAACYRAIDWRGLGAPVNLCLTATGGHVGFHEAGRVVPWHDRAAAAFFDAR